MGDCLPAEVEFKRLQMDDIITFPPKGTLKN